MIKSSSHGIGSWDSITKAYVLLKVQLLLHLGQGRHLKQRLDGGVSMAGEYGEKETGVREKGSKIYGPKGHNRGS